MQTDYHPSFDARARDLSFIGATDQEMAFLFGISINKLKLWKETYPSFDFACRMGVMEASARVAVSLFKRACGYEYTKWKETKDGDKLEELVHVPADVGACIFWLTNKAPGQWKSRVEHDVSPESRGLISDALSEIEAARRIAFALSKAMNLAGEERQRSNENGSSGTGKPQT